MSICLVSRDPAATPGARRKWRLALGLLTAWFVTGASPTAAPAASPDPRDIRDAIEERLADPQGVNLRYAAPVRVTRSGAGFDIVVSQVALDHKDGSSFHVGDVNIYAEPRSDGYYDVSVAFADGFTLLDPKGLVSALIAIGNQRLDGVWAPEFEAFVELDAEFRNITGTSPEGKKAVELDVFSIRSATVQTGDGLWTSPTRLRLAGLRATDPGGEGSFFLEAIDVNAEVEGLRLEQQAELAQMMSGELPDLTPEELAAYPRPFGHAEIEIEMRGIAFANPSDGTAFELERLTQRYLIRDFDTDRATIEFLYDHEGLSVAAGPDMPEEFVPRRAVVDVALVGLPSHELWQIWLGALQQAKPEPESDGKTVGKAEPVSTDNPAHAPDPGEIAGDQLLAAITNAGTEFRIRDLFIDTPGLVLKAAGIIRAAADALQGATGEIDAELRGLDEIISGLAAAPPAEGEESPLGMLAFVQMLGVLEFDESTGTSIRRYRIELTPEGGLFINGNDLATMMGGPAQPQ
jgi:hypothetical protein